MSDPEEDNQQFEQVLTRLDALMKRSHGIPPNDAAEETDTQMLEITLPPLDATDAAATEMPAAAPEENCDAPVFVLEEKEAANIPVLTEVYDGALSLQPPPDPREETIDSIVDALIPLMLDNLDMIVAEEAAKMQLAIADRLRSEIGETLRQRLLQRR